MTDQKLTELFMRLEVYITLAKLNWPGIMNAEPDASFKNMCSRLKAADELLHKIIAECEERA